MAESESSSFSSKLTRWTDRLQNLTVSSLTRDYPEPSQAEPESVRRPIEASQTLRISQKIQGSLKQLQITDGARPHSSFSILISALAVLVSRLTGDENVTLGTSAEEGEPFVLKTPIALDETFSKLLQRVDSLFTEYANDAIPLEKVIEKLKSTNNTSKAPTLFRFALYHAPNAPSQEFLSSTSSTNDLIIYLARSRARSSSDVSGINGEGHDTSMELRAYYNQRLFSSARISTILSQILQIVDSVSKNPQEAIGRIPLAEGTQSELLPDPTKDLDWSGFRGAIQEIFAENAAKHPERLCVVETPSGRHSPQREFTYGHIDEASNVLGHHFLQSGIQRGEVIMIYAYRGVDLVVAIMGVLKAGATFSVIDPLYPPDRQNIYLDVARPRALVVIEKATREAGKISDTVRTFMKENLQLRTEIPGLMIQDDGTLIGGNVEGKDVLCSQISLKSKPTGVVVGPDSTPTLSFTSGSEGRPKGVRGRHFSLAYYFPWMAETFHLSADDKFTMLSGIAHDPIQRDIFTPLFLGAQLLVPAKEDIQNEKLAEWMKKYGATVTHLTPAMGQILVGGASAEFPALHHAFFVGDILIKRDCRLLQRLASNVNVVNMYGTTETQRAVSFFEIPSWNKDPTYLDSLKDVIPAGKGMHNVQLLVVNRFDPKMTCAVGEVGEIYVRAGGLAEGYLGQELKELTEKKFVQNWFVDPKKWVTKDKELSKDEAWREFYQGPRDRLYRSGDLGRYTPWGEVECSGRADDQVKIRGFRIELGEIDTHLSRHELVRENVTLVRRDKDEEPNLVSYFVPEMSKWTGWLAERGLKEEKDEDGMVGMLKRFRFLRDDARDYLRTKLPAYAVPTVFIPLARMPLNPNGKIDKPALPFPDSAELSAASRRRRSTAASVLNETEKTLAQIWGKLIPHVFAKTIRPEDSFFDLGGHSILAQQMFFAVRKQWRGVDVSMNAIFRSPTLRGFASEIDRLQDPQDLQGDVGNQNGSAKRENGFLEQTEDYQGDAIKLAQALPTRFPSARALPATQEATVFLTGATGFLGAFLLRDLLSREKPQLKVIAHVRAKSSEAALTRVQQTCEAYGVWSPSWTARLECVTGNLGAPKLGMQNDVWDRIAQEADIVIHNGAWVHWVYPYSHLKPSNVQGTIDILQLCATGKAKKISYVSSTSVLDTEYYVNLSDRIIRAGGKGVSEWDDLDGSAQELATGYGQSKWVGEYLVREAGRRGLRGAIIRPGYVTGDSKTGVTNTDDFLVRMIKGSIQLSSRPDINNTVNMVPVNQVARIVIASAFSPPNPKLSVAQVTSHPRLRFNEFLATLETYGYKVPKVDYVPWRTSLERYVAQGGEDGKEETHALMPLYHFVTSDLPSSTKAPELEDVNAAMALLSDATWTGDDLSKGSAVTEDTMGVYLAYLIEIGFLRGPDGKGKRDLPAIALREGQMQALAKVGGRGGLV